MYAAGLKGSSGSVRNPIVKYGTAAASSSSYHCSTTGEAHGEEQQQQRGIERKCIGALPPNVDGRPRGTLTVSFGNFLESPRLTPGSSATTVGIRWNSTKVYVAVDLQLVWWGQKASVPVGTLQWTQGRKESVSVHYEVRTSVELFRRYLKSCEPVRLRLYSKRTQTLIGTAKVPIPGKIINFNEIDTLLPITAQASGEILSVRGFRLGELCLQFSLKLDPKELQVANPPKPTTSQSQKGKENRKMLCVEQPLKSIPSVSASNAPLIVEGKLAPLHETKQRPLTGGSNYLTAAKKKFHTLDHESKRKVLDYLTGKPFDDDHSRPSSERSTLSEICSISPAESMLEALARFDAAPDRSKHTYLQAVDCVRVLVEGLRLTRAGQKEMQHRTKNQWLTPAMSGFIVKMKFSRNPTTTLLKFFSTPMAFDEVEVSFESQSKTTRLVLPSGGDEGATFEFGIHLNVGSTIAKARLFHLGSASVTLRELLDGRLGCYKRCPVRLAADDILLGTLTIRMQLGRRGLHFGSDLIDAVMVNEGNVTLESDSSDSDSWDGPITEPLPTHKQCHTHRPRSCGHQMGHLRHHGLFPSASWTCTGRTGCPADNQNPSAKQSKESNASGTQQSNPGGKEQADGPSKNNQNGAPDRQQSEPNAMETETSSPGDRVKLLHGLLHLGQLRSLPDSDYFLVSHPFWTEDSTTLTSELCPEGGNFNYLHTFPVLANGAFIERVRNQHMMVELWQKPRGEPEKLLGLTRLPLHQFYIAFRDAQLSEHLSRAKLPVISIDGWSTIGSPLAGEPCGDIQAILAIGTESQIEHFKTMRNLQHMSTDVPRSLANRGTVPTTVSVSSPTRRIYPRPEHKSIQTMSSGAKQPQTSEVANMLSAFIENLAQRLPISSERSTAPSYDHNNQSAEHSTDGPHVGSPHSNSNRPQLRKTADLLDNLQKALSQRPPASALDGLGGLGGLGGMASLLGATSTPADQTPPAAGAGTANGQPHDATVLPATKTEDVVPTTSCSEGTVDSPPSAESSSASKASPSGENTSPPIDECKVFRVAIEVEQAVNLPKLTISKKYAKRHKNRNVPDTLELEPSAYATFEGYNLKAGMPNTVKSHEGIVYTTHVLERNCAPGWQKRFEVQLPVDLMMNDEKRFILKVWRKAALSDAPKCRLLPAPMEDAVIGFCAIDLSVLLSGMPYILGWYNIMDFSGRCNGQIKVNVQPLENVQVYKTLDEQMNFQIPLSIDVDCSAIGLDAASNTSLSRALKRKFTELEEITERLKARLFDVTGDDAVDPEDQFERDLNTEAEEEEDDSWLDQFGDTSNQKRNSQYPNGALTLTTNTSSYSMCVTDRRVNDQPERSLTGCSNRNQARRSEQLQLQELIQTHDLDTLINPALIKNLLNPSNSDETPTLVDDYAGGEAATDADMSDGSSSSRSSLLPNDNAKQQQHDANGAPGTGDVKVRQIASALQRATISGANYEGTTDKCREAPEGEPMKDVNN
uniref:C2 domain-containing protein n=1 Tax=Anopheles christyi TaxID=43041 RepID=A0A182JP16_9DIPT